MNDLLNSGSHSLLAFQRALATTSHNIANLNTEGYSRQRVDLEAVNSTKAGNGFIGNGVRATGVERMHDQFAMTQVLQSTSAHAQYDANYTMASRIDNLVSDDSLSLTPVLNEFFNAIQDVNSNPTSSSAKEVFLSTVESVSNRMNSLQTQLDGTQDELNMRTQAAVDDINQLSSELADINARIESTGFRSSGNQPNDLLDRRDKLIQELSEFTDITQVKQDDYSVNIFMGNGVGLVIGTRATQLRTASNPLTADQLDIEVSQGDDWKNITNRLSGGTIGGLQDFSNNTLKSSMNQLGQIALQFSDSINTQHAKGIDSNGDRGTDVFSVAEPTVMANETNTGTASITSIFSDISQIQPSDYDVRYTGTDFRITRMSDQTISNSNLPLTIDGMEITMTGTPADGDTFRISPVRRAAASMDNILTNTSKLALASPIQSTSSIANKSDSLIDAPTVDDHENPALRDEIDIRFSTATSYDIIDGNSGTTLLAGLPYTPGTPIAYNGWEAEIQGTPQTGDEFTVLPNNTGQGNNTNGLAMASLQSAPEMTGGKTFNEEYSSMVSRIGGETRNLQIRGDALDNMRLDALDRQQAVAGVNLDEEAINLSRFEQAYEASAQIMSTAETLFQTLISVVRR